MEGGGGWWWWLTSKLTLAWPRLLPLTANSFNHFTNVILDVDSVPRYRESLKP